MELYHALNRGVDRRSIFLDDSDRLRFVHDLYEFNDTHPAEYPYRTIHDGDFVSPHMREKIVDIHGWTLMDNHYHLLLSELTEGGLTLFLRKLNIGYAKFFNERYGRSGTLFQGRTKKIPITQEAHYLYILHYLHLNALDSLEGAKGWRERSKSGIENLKEALTHLDAYRWSSYRDYAGKKNFPSILTTDLFQEKSGDYMQELQSYLRDAEFAPSERLNLE